MVGQTVLVRLIGVRVPISQLEKNKYRTRHQPGAVFVFFADREGRGREGRTQSRNEPEP